MSAFVTTGQMVSGLRAVADFFEANPVDIGENWYLAIEAFGLKAEQMAAVASTPGTWEKSTTGTVGDIFMLSREIGGLPVEVHAPRSEVCVAVPTGRKTTVKKVATPAVYEDVEVDEVEWKCEPLLARSES